MKHKGNYCDYLEERNAALRAAFKSEMKSGKHRNALEAMYAIKDRKAPRFYISEERALVVIRYYKRHGTYPGCSRERGKLFAELIRRYETAKSSQPMMKDADIVYEIVNSEAPSFYLTSGTLRTLIYGLYGG